MHATDLPPDTDPATGLGMTRHTMSYAAHSRAILVLGLPLIGGHVAQFAVGLTDTVMLGWYGVEALAAVTLAASYFFVLFMMGSGFAWAVMPMVATFDASGDETGIRRATRMGFWLSAIFAAAAMPLLWWSGPILLALGQDPGVAADAASYLRLAGWGLFPALAMMVIKAYLAALGHTQAVLWMTCLGAVVNAVVNYALIFGNWGAPELGIHGAALASLGTYTVTLFGAAVYAVLRLPQHDLFARLWRPDWDMFGQVYRLGWPIGLTNLSEVSLFSASAVMMGWLGTLPLAAHGIAITLASAAFMAPLGLSNAAPVRVANAIGRSDWPPLARGAVTVTALSIAVGAAATLVFLAFPDNLIGLFLETDDPSRDAIIALGAHLLVLAALFQFMDGAQVVALGLLRGLQDTARPMLIAALSYWAVGMPACYLLGFVLGYGATGVWLGLVCGLVCAGTLLMWRFWATVRRRMPAPVAA